MTAPYDDSNIFARIIRGEIPCAKIHEDEHTIAFNDIHPQAPTHILVIPKGRYVSFADFSATASEAEIAALIRTVGKVAKAAGIEEDGYRLIANCGVNAHQEVPHLHIHILAGKALGPMLCKP